MYSRIISGTIGAFALLAINITTHAASVDEGPTDGSFTRQGSVVTSQALRMRSSYEAGYTERVAQLVNAQTWGIGSGNADTDDGKREWPKLLAEMYKVRNDATELQELIDGKGESLQDSRWAGKFFKPFSCPGYTMYYFTYKDKLDQNQRDKAHSMVKESGFAAMSREDGKMDPIYEKTEKNSENFNWMARLAGYLWAYELNDTEHKSYFDNYVKKWVRALFNSGRIEWNSNGYWGYCFNPCLVLHEHAQDGATKTRALAALDWQAIELALHYIDGTTTGADVRAKSGSYKPFPGTAWLYGYLFFADDAHRPSYSVSDATEAMKKQSQMVGFPPHSSYRPPQVALDIAHRKYKTPIEIHSAKPFYQADYDNYAHWKGDHALSRRFDFETIYLEKNYTLSSVATNYPAGVDCFYEQNVWKLGVVGNGKGALQIFGNTGGFDNAELSCGRSPYEQIGQYRNVMMRLIKGTDLMWVALPNEISVEYDGNIASADLGNDVYVAFIPYNAAGISNTSYSKDETYTQYRWSFDDSKLGALVMEVGTGEEHGSYTQFKTAIGAKTSFTNPVTDQIEYTATSERKIKMQFMPLRSDVTYWHGAPNQPAVQKNIPVAGVVPKVWCDDQYLDFTTWQGYNVVSGEDIIEQNWGSGALRASVNGKGMQIIADPVTADVEYRAIGPLDIASRPNRVVPDKISYRIDHNGIHFDQPVRSKGVISLFSINGRLLYRFEIKPEMHTIDLPTLSAGIFVSELNFAHGGLQRTPFMVIE